MGALHEDQYTFLIILVGRSNLRRVRNVSDKICWKKNLYSIAFFENRAMCEIMWKYIIQPDRPHMTIQHMRIACWIPKATNTHSEYVILIAFPLQLRLHKCASLLRYTCIACLVIHIQSWTNSGSCGCQLQLHCVWQSSQ